MTPRGGGMEPRQSDALRGVLAARLAARTCSQLPTGFWQRRVAARAFGLTVVPPVDRNGPDQASFWTLTGTTPIFVVETPVALWGFVAQPGESAVSAINRLRRLGRRDFVAVLMVTAGAEDDWRVDGPAERPAVVQSSALQIARVTTGDLLAIFEEAAMELPGPQRTLAALAARSLQGIDDSRAAIAQDRYA